MRFCNLYKIGSNEPENTGMNKRREITRKTPAQVYTHALTHTHTHKRDSEWTPSKLPGEVT